MVIQTLERSFAVIRMMESSDDTDIFVCRDLAENNDRDYLLVCVKDRELIARIVPFYTKMKYIATFDDFVDCFSQDSRFYIVFKHNRDLPLDEKLRNDKYSLEERTEMAQNLTSLILLKNMPPKLLFQALSSGNVVMSDSLSVKFNYNLFRIREHEGITETEYQQVLYHIFTYLFKEEIDDLVSLELVAYIGRLEEERFTDYLDIHRQFVPIYDQLMKMAKNGIKKQSFLFRLWEAIKKAAKFAKPVFMGLLLVVIIGAAFYILITPDKNTKDSHDFKSIGSVYINEEDAVLVGKTENTIPPAESSAK